MFFICVFLQELKNVFHPHFPRVDPTDVKPNWLCPKKLDVASTCFRWNYLKTFIFFSSLGLYFLYIIKKWLELWSIHFWLFENGKLFWTLCRNVFPDIKSHPSLPSLLILPGLQTNASALTTINKGKLFQNIYFCAIPEIRVNFIKKLEMYLHHLFMHEPGQK